MKKLLLVVICVLVASTAMAETSGFQLSLTPDVALQAKTTTIRGFSLGLWSENPQTALAIGLVNGSSGQSSGVSFGLGNYAEDYTGAQLGWLGNYASGRFSGLQWAPVNYAGNLNGVQLGLINIAKATEQGVQLGLVNIIQQTTKWFENFPDEVAPAMIFVNWRF